ncbi:hypothetical protein FA048_09575 [Pedobacter polaris]|uniref:Uncharacterized protein n=1 Tax=Pedobacter polaris TaxID=2571273 RepID=A0A4U1CW08_9SPHI|nr:hypothetical protein [Pedobacter polaris]TKC10429.1 hypothetical protein FA048_09575 [Pedobacter polaris]
MKYHYQFVSKTKVRIEVIPEDRKESSLLEALLQENEDNNLELTEYFRKGLSTYNGDAILTKTNFMKYPKVALCSFEISVEAIENLS